MGKSRLIRVSTVKQEKRVLLQEEIQVLYARRAQLAHTAQELGTSVWIVKQEHTMRLLEEQRVWIVKQEHTMRFLEEQRV